MQACKGKSAGHTPIWLNRQAGRYLPEYLELKGNRPSLEFFTNPELAAQATLDAQRILGVDAAIVFADLLPILQPMGLDLHYESGIGPVISNPIRSPTDVTDLRVVPATEGVGYIRKTIKNVLEDLPLGIALIGFAGAPFTLAAYAIEGRGSQQFARVKRFMYTHPELWGLLLDKISESVADYVTLQIDSGVNAVQIFDSWVGCLSDIEYQRYVLPSTKKMFNAFGPAVPKIYFATSNQHLLASMYNAGADFLALDWRVPLVDTWDALGCIAIQGNMDPIALCSTADVVEDHAKRILDEVRGKPGHIFNLGHGIVPETPVDNVKRLVDFVHEYSSQ